MRHGSPVAAQKSYEIPSLDEARLDRCAAELGVWIPAKGSEVTAAKGVLGLRVFFFLPPISMIYIIHL